MEERLILDNWSRAKLSVRNFYRLEEPLSVEYEYRHQFGHPSSYAYVYFECESAEQLRFESVAHWGESLSPNYVAALESVIGEAIVDALMCISTLPYRGCLLKLCGIKWDDVGSSEAAFYEATKMAMKELVKCGRWKIETNNRGNL